MENIIGTLKSRINLTSFLSSLGYEFNRKKSTKKYMFLEQGHDKILIYSHGPGNEDLYYTTCNNPDDKGDIFNFVLNRGICKDYREAISHLKSLDSLTLSEELREKQNSLRKKEEIKPFTPVKMQPVDEHNYLIKERWISLETLREEIFEGTVFSGTKSYTDRDIKNAIFPLWHFNHIVGQNLRNVAFEHLIENSDKTNGWWHSQWISKPKTFFIFENPIDAISHYMLKKPQQPIYLGTIGSPSYQVISRFTNLPFKYLKAKFKLCGDNDVSGQFLNLNFTLARLNAEYDINLKTGYNTVDEFCYIKAETTEHSQKILSIIEAIDYKNGQSQFMQSNPTYFELRFPFNFDALTFYVDSLVKGFKIDRLGIERSVTKDFNQDLIETLHSDSFLRDHYPHAKHLEKTT